MVKIDVTTVSTQLSDTILNGQDAITYLDVRNSSLPDFIKTWFHMGVETWYVQEYKWRTANLHFNFKDKNVAPFMEQFDRAVKDTACFARKECLKVIEGAIQHESDYFHHPIRALAALLFRNSEVVDGIHLVDFLTQFQREQYYAEAVKMYVLDHEDTRLDQELFEQFLSNAERDSFRDQPAQSTKQAVAAVGEILSLAEPNGSPQNISLNIIEDFVSIRGLDQLFPRLNDIIISQQEQQASHMTIEGLMDAIDSDVDKDTQDRVVEESSPDTIQDEPLGEIATEQPAGEKQDESTPMVPSDETPQEDLLSSNFAIPTEDFIEDESEIASTFAPPSDDFEEEDLPPESELEPDTKTPESTDDKISDKPEPIDVPVSSMNFADEADGIDENNETDNLMNEAIANTTTPPRQPAIQVPSVEISDKLRKMFIKKLFNKDEAIYTHVLSQLEPALSWEETFSIIEEIWQEKGLNLFSKESQEFTRVFYERYFPPS